MEPIINAKDVADALKINVIEPKINEKYAGELAIVITTDGSGKYNMKARNNLLELGRELKIILDPNYGFHSNPLVIYGNVNEKTFNIVGTACEDLQKGKSVDLERLLE